MRLGSDFVHDGAPDPWVALGADGFRRDALIAPLAADEGEQTYPVPARLMAQDFTEVGIEVYIWCEKFSTSLGRARLGPVGG